MKSSRRKFAVVALALFLFVLPLCCLGQSLGESLRRARASPYFYVGTTFFCPPGEEEGTLEVYYDISYSQLQFLKNSGGFLARFEVQAILYDSKKRQVEGDSWRRTVRSTSYRETVSPDGSFHETFKLAVAPGKYTLLVRTENLDSEEQSSVVAEIELQPVRSLPAVSELLLGSCNRDSALAGSLRSRVTPHPRSRFGERYPRFCAYGEIYDAPAEDDTASYRLAWRILDEEDSLRLQDTVSVPKRGQVSPFFFSGSVTDLTMGRYRLELVFGEGRGAQRTSAVFEVDESKFAIDDNIEDTLTLLGYIAQRSEIEPMREAVGEERKRLWLEFWKKRDPYPETPENEYLIEFFDRVRYANHHFSSLEPGWKTDRGRIYIRRGPPDQVERRPMSPSGPAYEVWSYFEKNLTFVFVDRMGFGEYELIGPSLE